MRLRSELYITDGFLFKEPQKGGRFKQDYYRTHMTIDFKYRLIRFKDGDFSTYDQLEPNASIISLQPEKDLPFEEVLEVRSLEMGQFKKDISHKLPY